MSTSKKIEELVYSGKVIDDHGNWIPIAEKLRKEKIFLSHLERGEILLNGKWKAMTDLPAEVSSIRADTILTSRQEATVHDETTLDPPEGPEETVYLSTEPSDDTVGNTVASEVHSDSTFPAFTSDETVALATDAIRDLKSPALPADTGDDIEFPPETKSMFVEVAPPPETTQNVATEFEETSLYNIKVLKNTPTEPADSTTDRFVDSPSNSAVSDPFEIPPEKHGFPFFPVTVAAIFIILAVVILLLSKFSF